MKVMQASVSVLGFLLLCGMLTEGKQVDKNKDLHSPFAKAAFWRVITRAETAPSPQEPPARLQRGKDDPRG